MKTLKEIEEEIARLTELKEKSLHYALNAFTLERAEDAFRDATKYNNRIEALQWVIAG